MSCQIGALDERELHFIGEQLTSISGSMFSPEQIIKLYGCVPTRFLLLKALNKDCLCTGFHAAPACSFHRCSLTPNTRSHRISNAAPRTAKAATYGNSPYPSAR